MTDELDTEKTKEIANSVLQNLSSETEQKSAESKDGLVPIDELNKESIEIINNLVKESDLNKTKDLTYLFNVNQNKKTMVRANKLNELLDVITDQTTKRFSAKPDEISNKELLDGLKVVQDIIERSQKQVAGVQDTPLIQINQQNNEVNLGPADNLSKESREKIQKAVAALLTAMNTEKEPKAAAPAEIIEAEVVEPQEEEK